MAALAAIAVQCRYVHALSVFKAEHRHVGLIVPHGEGTVIGLGEHQEPPVGRYTRERGAAAFAPCIVERIDTLAQQSRIGVETYAQDIIMYLLALKRHRMRLGRTEDKPPSIGCPRGECLPAILALEPLVDNHLSALRVVYHQIRPLIIHL